MTALRDIFTTFAAASLERYPHLPLAHRKVSSASQQCHSGPYGHSLSQCYRGGEQHRVKHSCGNRHCPQGQQHKTQQWLQPHLDQQLPGPYCLLTFTVPETLRPFIRSPHRLAYQAMFQASATALKRLAQEQRCIGTALPGFTGVLHTWGRQLQYHPHIHYIVPGGGLSADRSAWLPSRANFFVPVKALSPIYRALFQKDMRQAGLLEHISPQVWTIPWNVHSQANHHGHSAFTSLAPYVFKVAIANSRIVCLKDRTVTFTYRKPGSARSRPTNLDAMEFICGFLQHVLPDGCMKVRHFGFMHASSAIHPDTIRQMIWQVPPSDSTPMRIVPPPPRVALCPTCGAPMRVVLRLWTSNRAFVDTG
jgi:putative transposase/transposase-like zinc-binding protein